MTPAFDVAVVWTARVAGAAALLGAYELARLRGTPIDRAVQRGRHALRAIAALQGLAGAALLFTHTPVAGLLALALLLAADRFGGSVNGGSDAMLFTVSVGLAVAQWDGAPAALREAGLLYVAVQCTLSYVRAGLVKVRERSWWTGQALHAFVQLPAYGVPTWATRLPLRTAGMAVMLLECAAPLAWLGPRAAAAAIVLGLGFHATTIVLFGLTRFFWAWAAAYPALWYAATRP